MTRRGEFEPTVGRFTETQMLFLSSQRDFVASLPNLGDRALFAGLSTLIERHGGSCLQHAPWKAFPYLTRNALDQSGLAAEAALRLWVTKVKHFPNWRYAVELRLAHLLDWPLSAVLAKVSGLESMVRINTGEPWDAPLRARLRALRAREMIDLISSADAALYNAIGLFSDHLSRYLPARLFEPYLAMRLGKPVAIVNYSIDLMEPVNRALAGAVLPDAQLHLVREPRSRDTLLGIGVPAERIIVSVDTAFANTLPLRAVPAEESTDVAIMVRGDRRVDYDAWATLVETLRHRFGVRVHYLHGCLQHDPAVRRALGSRCQLDDDGRPKDLPELLATLDRMAVLITDRYHPVIFALQTGTPVVPIAATTHKTQGLLELARYPVALLPPISGKVTQHLETIAAVWEQRALLSAHGLGFAADARLQLHQDYAELFLHLKGEGGQTSPATSPCPLCPSPSGNRIKTRGDGQP